MNKAIG